MAEQSENSKDLKVQRPKPAYSEIDQAIKEFDGQTMFAIGQEIATLKKEVAHWKELASVDPLTKVLNRRGMEETFERVKGVLQREGDFQNYAVLFIDAVGLKTINDTLGEAEGDKRLISIAEAAKKTSMRDYDIVARVGGDEFMLIFPNIGSSPAEEGLRNLVTRLLSSLPEGTELNIGACLWKKDIPLSEAFARSAEANSQAKDIFKTDKTGRSEKGAVVYFLDNE